MEAELWQTPYVLIVLPLVRKRFFKKNHSALYLAWLSIVKEPPKHTPSSVDMPRVLIKVVLILEALSQNRIQKTILMN